MQAIDTRRLAWRTRGVDWDYDFIITPQLAPTEDHYAMFSEVFQEMAATAGGANALIEFKDAKEFIVAATCFIDPDIFDKFGRPIQHFFTLTLQNEQDAKALPNDWGMQLLRQLRPLHTSRKIGETPAQIHLIGEAAQCINWSKRCISVIEDKEATREDADLTNRTLDQPQKQEAADGFQKKNILMAIGMIAVALAGLLFHYYAQGATKASKKPITNKMAAADKAHPRPIKTNLPLHKTFIYSDRIHYKTNHDSAIG